jgi:hypothetical protein
MSLKKLYLCTLLASTLGFSAANVFGQEPSNAPTPDGKPTAPAMASKTLFEQIKEGGWVMIPISLCSVFTVYLIGDGILRTGRKRLSPIAQEQTLKTLFRHGDYVRAYTFCKTTPSPLTNVLRVGISLLGVGQQCTGEGGLIVVLLVN